MKFTVSTAILFLLVVLPTLALSQAPKPIEKAYIEVTGFAERWVEPDQFFLFIRLKDKEEGRNKRSIAEQEKLIVEELKKLQIPVSQFKRANARNQNHKIFWGEREDTQMDYQLELSSADQIAAVMEYLDEIDVKLAYLDRVDLKNKKEIEREIELEAMRKARDKAVAWLGEIGATLGKPLIIRSTQMPKQMSAYGEGIAVRGSISQPDNYYIDGNKTNLKQSLSFKDLHFKFGVYIKFEISE